MVQLIALDVDGTMVDSKGDVPDEIFNAIRQAQKSGILVTIISGRTRRSLSNLLQKAQIDLPYAGSNGGFIASPSHTDPLVTYPINSKDVSAIVQMRTAYNYTGISFHYIDQTYYDPGGYAWIKSFAAPWAVYARESDLSFMMEELPAPLKIEIMGEKEVIASFVEDFSHLNDQLNTALGIDPRVAEVTAYEATKGNALKQLAELLHVSLKDTAACGDGISDVSMLRVAGYPIAMGNAHPVVKAVSRLIAPSNDQAGVAWAIHALLSF